MSLVFVCDSVDAVTGSYEKQSSLPVHEVAPNHPTHEIGQIHLTARQSSSVPSSMIHFSQGPEEAQRFIRDTGVSSNVKMQLHHEGGHFTNV